MNESFVLDASALLCLLKDESGAEQVVDVLPYAVISAVNLSEIYAKLADAGGSEEQIARAIGVLHLKVEPFAGEQIRIAGMMRPATRSLGLSLGDRACLALARHRRAVAVTADRTWTMDEAPRKSRVAVRSIR